MNKTILLIFVLISLAFVVNFASAKRVVRVTDNCKCDARAVVKCGFSKSDEAKKCRAVYSKKCNTRCNLINKCSNQIASECVSFKKGALEYKRCERATISKKCVSLLNKEELYNCKCKSFAKAVCGTCPSPAAVNCRDDAYENCKKQCGTKLPCKSKKRICITEKGCNCKAIAKSRCAVDEDRAGCYAKQYDACNKRCLASSRCYPVSCKNAGQKRCARAVAIVCDKFSADLNQYEQCVEKKTERCLSFERATCKKARRLFKYRSECDYAAKVTCEPLSAEKKCACVKEVREKCVKQKIQLRKKYIRHTATCRKRATLLCDAKEHCKDLRACYIEETKHCVRRHKRREHICPPECVEKVTDFCGSQEGECYKKNLEECTEQWLRRYCERNAFEVCDGDLECMKQEIAKCKHRVPKCWENRDLCNDHNKCTDDVCDPKVGCIHIAKTCNDNNLCTEDVCDPNEGCKNTEIKCDDGVACTKDYCNPVNGKCQFEKDHSRCTTSDKCTVGFCGDKGCEFKKDKTGKCKPREEICKDCVAKNKCQQVDCQIQDDLTPKCVVTELNCDDKKRCTEDYCDVATGKCVHKKISGEGCEPPLCEDILDCAAWSVKQKLSEQCFVAECNADLGVCAAKPVSNKDCVPVAECQEKCKPRDACEGPSTSCTRDKEGLVVCNRPDYPCDDHSECTKDACNLNTGVCSHVFVRNDKDCIEYCESDSFCIEWAIQSGLDEDCKTAVCDKQKKSCKVVPKLDTSRCGTSCKGCKKTKCDVSAKCVLDAQSKPACVRVQKKCDDENPCTVDTCDLETGKCVNTFVPSKVCKKCENAEQCEAWGKTLNLAPICKTAVCDAKTKRCVVSKLPGKCTTPVCVDCVAKNACEEAVCTFDSNGKPYCARSARTCDDNNDCTVDTCDLKTGKCIHEETKCKICNFDSQCKDWGVEKKLSETCQEAFCTRKGKCKARLSADQSKCPTKKQECVDCVSLNKCDSAKCVIESGIAKCVHSQTTCNDGDKCTTDYCDVTTGECVYKQIQSDECKICKADKDCADYAKQQKLSESCLESFCENNYCRERPTADQSKCLKIPLCYDCVATPCDETAQCKFDKDGKPVCERTKKVCNDNNKCTVDSCDLKTGDCVHTFFKTSQCEACETDVDCKEFAKIRNLDDNCETATCNPKGYCQISKNPDTSKCGNKCTTDKDCAAWAVDKKLADSCKEATCVANKCVARTMKDLSKCDKCRLECVAKNACETATCINSEAGYICDRTQKNCDDKQDCTADSCDVTSGKCVNKVIESEKCKICTVDKDCVAFAKVVKPNNCEEVFCDATLKLCSKRPIADKTCVPEEFCKLQCPVKDKCYDAKCHYDKNNKVVCDTPVLKNCDDKDDCTDDSCVPNRGCVHTTSNKCTKCLNVNDCTKYAISKELDAKCQEPFCNEKGNCDARPKADKKCVPADICTKSCATPNKCQSFGCEYDVNGKVQCTYVIKTCDDAIECTKDYCDEKTGLCVHDRTKCGPPCQFTPNCVQWGAEQQLASKCQEAYCDQKIKACVAVKSSDVTKCQVKDCDKVCVSKNKCETMKCAYDKNEKVICIPSPVPGCTPCKEEADCSGLKKTATQCEKVYCDAAQGKCIKESVKTPECTKVCPPTCQASSLCEVARIVQTETTCECKITPISCDDGKSCTEDSCDAKSGKCRNVFKTSDKCVKECTKDVECARFAIDNKLSDKCQVAYCDVKSGSCAVKDDDVTNCKKCQLECKPSNNCETAVCAWDGAKYTCARTTKTCDDGKSCTTDKCDAATGKCVYTYVCDTNICNTDLDCAAWGLANKLESKCLKPVCNTKDATCQSVPDERCKTICKKNSDCPPTKFGSVCDTETSTCKPNECYFDSDCLGKSTKDTWAYCKPVAYTGQKVCKEEPKCKANKDCDDKDPCTSDYCLAEYGFCHNIKKCDDKNECTIDIATPNKDNTCTCSHVPVSCTTDATLLAKSFVSLTADEKSKWLGKCDKNRGCISCVVNSQCDDHNGCSTDSCENQVCSNKYVTYNNGEFNPWCDPKLASQPIYFQSIPGLRDQLALAGYDINKLAN